MASASTFVSGDCKRPKLVSTSFQFPLACHPTVMTALSPFCRSCHCQEKLSVLKHAAVPGWPVWSEQTGPFRWNAMNSLRVLNTQNLKNLCVSFKQWSKSHPRDWRGWVWGGRFGLLQWGLQSFKTRLMKTFKSFRDLLKNPNLSNYLVSGGGRARVVSLLSTPPPQGATNTK